MKIEIVTRYVVDVPVRLADVLISEMKAGTKWKNTQQKHKPKIIISGGRKPYADWLIDWFCFCHIQK